MDPPKEFHATGVPLFDRDPLALFAFLLVDHGLLPLLQPAASNSSRSAEAPGLSIAAAAPIPR